MLFLKKKKLFSIKPKSLEKQPEQKSSVRFGGDSPSLRKYKTKCAKYGKPERNGSDGEPTINAFGIACFPDGSKFVQDCMTGDIIERDSSVRYLGSMEGQHFYLGAMSDFLETAESIGSFSK